jgi:catechol 2,3-dioxygenase-like lactoylglutathione lyase family enzyme
MEVIMHIIEVRLKCGDLAAARTFYGGTLGLSIVEESPDLLVTLCYG